MIDDIVSKKDSNISKTPFELLKKIENIDKAVYKKILNMIQDFRIKFVLNQLRDENEVNIGLSMARACKKYFGIESEFLGGVHYDSVVWKSIQKKNPVCINEPDSKTSKELGKIMNKLLKKD